MSTPAYTLPIYPIHESVVDDCFKLARNFFWHRSGNHSGFSLIGWSRATLDKTDGAQLATINLRHLRTAYLTKNALN